ncbi:MAG: carbohydrate kinase family protein [bacterium]
MKTKFDVLTIGGAVQDITFYTSDGKLLDNPDKDPTCLKLLAFEYGAKIKIDEANFSFGGGAQNAAVCFSRLGFKTAALVIIGLDSTGEEIIRNLKINQVNTKFVQKNKKLGTGFSFVLTDRKTSEHVIFSYRGASSELNVSEFVLKKIFPKWIYLTSLSGEWEKDVMMGVLKYKEKFDLLLAWNPGVRQLSAGFKKIKAYLRKTDVLIMNKDEATELVISGGIKGNEDAKVLIKDLHSMIYQRNYTPPSASSRQKGGQAGQALTPLKGGTGINASINKGGVKKSIAVVTEGKKGAYACDGKKTYYAPIIDVKRVDTTGVGDAFGSSFTAGLELYNGDIQKSLELGILNTSSVVGKVGAENGLLYRKDVI